MKEIEKLYLSDVNLSFLNRDLSNEIDFFSVQKAIRKALKFIKDEGFLA